MTYRIDPPPPLEIYTYVPSRSKTALHFMHVLFFFVNLASMPCPPDEVTIVLDIVWLPSEKNIQNSYMYRLYYMVLHNMLNFHNLKLHGTFLNLSMLCRQSFVCICLRLRKV